MQIALFYCCQSGWPTIEINYILVVLVFWGCAMTFSRISLIAVAVFTMWASSASATVVPLGAGWQEGEVNAAGVPSTNDPLTFTVAAGTFGIFSLSDAYISGDIWSVYNSGPVGPTVGALLGTSSFSNVALSAFPNSGGQSAAIRTTYNAAWIDTDYSHLQLIFGAGSYSISVEGNNGAGVLPAHFGYRIDVSAVPEASTWLMMILGFAGLGFVTYRRRSGLRLSVA